MTLSPIAIISGSRYLPPRMRRAPLYLHLPPLLRYKASHRLGRGKTTPTRPRLGLLPSTGHELSGGMWAAALWLLLATAAAQHDKRAEIAPAPFVVGSRYGRSPPRVITPRNDRFFMGSRYGKRSPPPHPPLPPAPLAPPAAIHCAYTGLAELYRCAPAPDPRTRYHTRKSDEDPYEEED